jgi:hypothetical protein
MPILDSDRFEARLREATRRGLLGDASAFAAAPTGPPGDAAGKRKPWAEKLSASGCLTDCDGYPGVTEAEGQTAFQPQQPARQDGGCR